MVEADVQQHEPETVKLVVFEAKRLGLALRAAADWLIEHDGRDMSLMDIGYIEEECRNPRVLVYYSPWEWKQS